MPNERARALRQSSTDAERRLWSILRGRRLAGHKFRRQRPIGPYIVDFVCMAHHLIIEADGSQHSESTTDVTRTAWLETRGWRVLRFWNNDIMTNADGVADAILMALSDRKTLTRLAAARHPLP